MSAESGLRVRIDYEDVAALQGEVKELSGKMEVLTDKMEKMHKTMSKVEGSSKKASKSLALIAGIKKLELVQGMNSLYKSMLNVGRASPLLASNMAVVDWQMEQIGMVIGDALAPLFETLSLGLETVIGWWEALDQPTKDAITTGIQVAAMLGIVAGAWIFLNSAMAPIIIAVLAVGLAVAGLMIIWNEFGDEIMNFLAPLIDTLTFLFMGFALFLSDLFPDPIGTITDLWKGFTEFMDNLFRDPFGAVFGAFNNLRDFIDNMGGTLGALIGYLLAPFFFFLDKVKFIFDAIDLVIKLFTGQIDIESFITSAIDLMKGLANSIIEFVWKPIDLIKSILYDISNIGFFDIRPFGFLHGLARMIPDAPTFHEGGRVGGAPGQDVPILAKADELILTQKQDQTVGNALDIGRSLAASIGNGGDRNTFNNQRNITVNVNVSGEGDRNQLGSSIADQLRRSIRSKGLT